MARGDAWALLCEYTQSENLRRHALAVEAALRAYARHFGEDEEQWAVVGLVHDLDYERWPDPADHPLKGAAILAEHGYPEHLIRAVKSHAEYLGLPRETNLEKALFAVDELTGFIVAVALVRPTRSIHDVTVQSVKKKMKDKAFAAAVGRDDIRRGAEELGVDLDQHIETVICAMQGIAEELGLAGS
jgi:putative nucleotidyltransferase with HDIG domain